MRELKKLVENKLRKRKIHFNKLVFLAGDASNRKYFKLIFDRKSRLVMYDNLGQVSIQNFISKSNFFSQLGVKVPIIFQSFPNDGILIIENFGNSKFSNILNKSNETKLYKLATDSLITLHKKKRQKGLELYNKKKFIDEITLFFDWYLPLYSEKMSEDNKTEFLNYFKELLDIPMKLPKVNIHRDYHIDNIFFLKNNCYSKQCGWIDYQDALFGTCVYDLMSLLEDARRDISINLKKKLIKYYIESFPNIEKELFIYSFKIIAIQRHLKVLGIFSRLFLRDKKKNYLIHIPRVLRLLRMNLKFSKFSKISSLLLPLTKKRKVYE